MVSQRIRPQTAPSRSRSTPNIHYANNRPETAGSYRQRHHAEESIVEENVVETRASKVAAREKELTSLNKETRWRPAVPSFVNKLRHIQSEQDIHDAIKDARKIEYKHGVIDPSKYVDEKFWKYMQKKRAAEAARKKNIPDDASDSSILMEAKVRLRDEANKKGALSFLNAVTTRSRVDEFKNIMERRLQERKKEEVEFLLKCQDYDEMVKICSQIELMVIDSAALTNAQLAVIEEEKKKPPSTTKNNYYPNPFKPPWLKWCQERIEIEINELEQLQKKQEEEDRQESEMGSVPTSPINIDKPKISFKSVALHARVSSVLSLKSLKSVLDYTDPDAPPKPVVQAEQDEVYVPTYDEAIMWSLDKANYVLNTIRKLQAQPYWVLEAMRLKENFEQPNPLAEHQGMLDRATRFGQTAHPLTSKEKVKGEKVFVLQPPGVIRKTKEEMEEKFTPRTNIPITTDAIPLDQRYRDITPETYEYIMPLARQETKKLEQKLEDRLAASVGRKPHRGRRAAAFRISLKQKDKHLTFQERVAKVEKEREEAEKIKAAQEKEREKLIKAGDYEENEEDELKRVKEKIYQELLEKASKQVKGVIQTRDALEDIERVREEKKKIEDRIKKNRKFMDNEYDRIQDLMVRAFDEIDGKAVQLQESLAFVDKLQQRRKKMQQHSLLLKDRSVSGLFSEKEQIDVGIPTPRDVPTYRLCSHPRGGPLDLEPQRSRVHEIAPQKVQCSLKVMADVNRARNKFKRLSIISISKENKNLSEEIILTGSQRYFGNRNIYSPRSPTSYGSPSSPLLSARLSPTVLQSINNFLL